MAEWPMGTMGTFFSSLYPLTSARSAIIFSNIRCVPFDTSHCWSMPGVIHTKPIPSFCIFSRKRGLSKRVSSLILCCPTRIVFTRIQSAGIHKKAVGFRFVSLETNPSRVTDHCHSPARRQGEKQSKRIIEKSSLYLFMVLWFYGFMVHFI